MAKLGVNMCMIMANIPIVSQLLQKSTLCNDDSVQKANSTRRHRNVLCVIDQYLNYYDHNNSILYCETI